MSSPRPSFLEELRDPVTGRIIPLKSKLPSPSGGGGSMVASAPEVEGPTVSAILEHAEWSPERPGGPQFSPPGSPEEKTPAERIRPKESPSLQRPQPCIGRKKFLDIIGCPPDAESLVPPPRIQRRLNLKGGLQSFPPPEEEEEEINPSAPKRYRVSID